MTDSTAGSAVLREMRWWDIDPVLALERELFPDDAWSRGMFWSELAHARGPAATRRYVVAEEPAADGAGRRRGRLVGYGGLAVSGELADVQTIAVTRDQWGTGLGRRLLTDLLRHATAFECAEVMLEVRVDNIRAQKLYHRFGFEPLGFRRGYYQPGNVDALVMRLMDPAHAIGTAAPPELPPEADGRTGARCAEAPSVTRAHTPDPQHPVGATAPERPWNPPHARSQTLPDASAEPPGGDSGTPTNPLNPPFGVKGTDIHG